MSNQTVSILPSLPAASLSELQSVTAAVAGITTEFQLDLVDGQFAPTASWPFTEAANISDHFLAAKDCLRPFTVEIDCMICDPQQYFKTFTELGAARVIIHYGSTDEAAAISAARAVGFTVGLAIMNDVDLTDITSLILTVDYVQVMGIAKIGVQGQPFDERTLKTITQLRTQYPHLEIAVDGSVNKSTITRLQEAGANRFAPGSAVSKATDPKAAFLELAVLTGLQQST